MFAAQGQVKLMPPHACRHAMYATIFMRHTPRTPAHACSAPTCLPLMRLSSHHPCQGSTWTLTGRSTGPCPLRKLRIGSGRATSQILCRWVSWSRRAGGACWACTFRHQRSTTPLNMNARCMHGLQLQLLTRLHAVRSMLQFLPVIVIVPVPDPTNSPAHLFTSQHMAPTQPPRSAA